MRDGQADSVGETGEHRFGGDWTEAKLAVLKGYLGAYTTALKNTPFRKGFIDAFAGTGYRQAKEVGPPDPEGFFPDLAAEPPQKLLAGSARIALETEPSFDGYVFIEKSPARCLALERLKREFPCQADRIHIRPGEANVEVRKLCAPGRWSRRRAVLFLDPYGMQVEWRTLEMVAETRAIDMWLLFPLGIGVNRLLTRSGEIPEPWRRRLDLLLGTSDWFEEFYEVADQQGSLFADEPEERLVKASMETIGRYFNERLRSIFAGVAERPGVLRNSSNSPLYLFCFAAANRRGAPTALRIAEHLLKGLR